MGIFLSVKLTKRADAAPAKDAGVVSAGNVVKSTNVIFSPRVGRYKMASLI